MRIRSIAREIRARLSSEPDAVVRRKAIAASYRSALGEPDRVAEYISVDAQIEIWKWTRKRSRAGVALYLTIGASDHLIGPDHRIEFYLGLRPATDSIVGMLAEVAAKPILEEGPIRIGHTITFPDPLWLGSSFKTMLVFRAVTPPIPDPKLSDGSHVQLLGLAPIHESELKAKQRMGFDAMWDKFREAQVPIEDPNRPPAL